MDLSTEQARELTKSEDAVQGLVVGKRVYDPLLFSPEIVQFSARQYIFLRSYRLGVPIEEAAQKAGMTVEAAERFLDKPKTIAWLQDRALKDHIKYEWEEPAKWWQIGNDVLEGKRQLRKDQQVVWTQFGERVAPIRRSDSGNTSKIEINIDPTAVQEAFRRQQAIEAEIVKEQT